MECILISKYTIRFTIVIILIILSIPNYFSFADSNHWDYNWSYYKEIKIPFDTSSEIAKFQPMDIKVDFQNPCWAKNELEHSIRVVCWDGINWHELESQIYSLEAIEENIIKSCNLVFLIPNFANGAEEYFVYYDDSEKPSPDYVDHVKIEESYYKYEPISGYSLESDYYKIIDDDYIAYSISYRGQLMGYNTGQHVSKLKEKTLEALPKNGELFAAFDFKYTYEKSLFGYSSTSQKHISKEILVDGNLMLEVRIVSHSKFDDLQTTGTYKYYHCPITNTRVHAHVKHETLEEISVTPIPPATNTDGVYASIQSGGVKSRTISELNIGRILPFMHFFNDMGTISEYELDIDPEYILDDPDIRIISYKDDVDLGENAWVSFDEGETGLSHSVIFSSNKVLLSGSNEKDGLQLNAFEVDYPHLPGLENNIATIQIGRNSFEVGENHDLIIPDDFIVEFDAEFFSSKTEGYIIIEKEAEIFRELVKIKPESTEEFNGDSDEIEKHDLSVLVHFAPSFPMGSGLSALLGLNLSYINVELYRNDEFIYSKNAVRLPIKSSEESGDPNILEQIITTIKNLDIKNISLFKKAVFPKIPQGKYVIKIFRENPLLSKEKHYIGYSIIDLQKDEKVNVFCSSEASLRVKIIDQNNNPVKNAIVSLQKDNANISKYSTNDEGLTTLKAPTSLKKYNFRVFYNGCTVYQEAVKFRILEKILKREKIVKIQRYNLNLKVKDTWGLSPEVDLNPAIKIIEPGNAFRIQGEQLDKDKFIFKNLTPNEYQLSLTFKSFNLNKNLKISKNEELNIEFPAEYDVNLKVMDARGIPFKDSKIILNRKNKKLEIKNQESETIVTIPPGEYQIRILKDNELIGVRSIGIYGEQNYDLVTKHQPIYPTIILIISCIIIFISLLFLYYKKKIRYFYIIVSIVLLFLALFLPWWEINGSTDQLQTSTNLYLIPNNMITITSTDNTTAGELSYLPPEFQSAISLIIIFTLTCCVLLIIKQFLENKEKMRLYKISKILIILSIVGSLAIFLIAINELSKVSIGGIFGSGNLELGIPGESQIYTVSSNWGPSIGLYLYLAASIILIIMFTQNFIKKREEKMNNNGKNNQTIQHPLFGISTKKWIYLLEKNGGVDKNYILRGFFITLASIFTAPARILFKIKYDPEINKTQIKYPPVIIIGHWRSGTTYLHELLSQDPQFCYVSLWHTLLPDSFLILEPIKKFLSRFLPKKRPMDEIRVDIDGPYEEEAAIAVLSPWSFFHCLHFPKNAEEQYLKSIHFEGLTNEEKDQWKENYLKIMKNVSFANDGKRLLLKNPANTTRITTLLELFPDASFIHIYRNPYKVYLSSIKMRNRVLDKLALQDASKEEIEKQVIENYKRVMNTYFKQKKQIPKGRLVDVKYEDLVKDPMKQVKRIYSKLKLPGLKNGIPGMLKYLEDKKDYKVNVYDIDKKILKHIKDNWKFTIDLWDYKPPK